MAKLDRHCACGRISQAPSTRANSTCMVRMFSMPDSGAGTVQRPSVVPHHQHIAAHGAAVSIGLIGEQVGDEMMDAHGFRPHGQGLQCRAAAVQDLFWRCHTASVVMRLTRLS